MRNFAPMTSCTLHEVASKEQTIMKKLFVGALALVAGTLVAQAQSIHPRIEVAGNFARTQVKNGDGTTAEGLKVRPGFRAGVAAEIGLASGIYVAPGVTFRQEGAKQGNVSSGLNYLSIPINLGIRVGLADALAVSVEAGPSFSYGVSSVSSVKEAVDEFKSGHLKRFDASINASAALEYSKVYLRVGTDLGMVNTFKEALQKASSKNASFYVGVGYRF